MDALGRSARAAAQRLAMSGGEVRNNALRAAAASLRANRGDILALRIEDEITLKRLRLAGGQAQLLPSNPLHETRLVPADRVEILGKLVGIVCKV